jgi:hypothetical protein
VLVSLVEEDVDECEEAAEGESGRFSSPSTGSARPSFMRGGSDSPPPARGVSGRSSRGSVDEDDASRADSDESGARLDTFEVDDEDSEDEIFRAAGLDILDRGSRLFQAAPKRHADVAHDKPILVLDQTVSCSPVGGALQERTELKVKLRRLRVVSHAAIVGRIAGWASRLGEGM